MQPSPTVDIMSGDTVTITVTRQEAVRLRTLIIQEARRKGYGQRYTSYGKAKWPPSLVRLNRIARKVYDALYPEGK